ncbi:MAG: DUF1874 domain-containing protein [Lachnospiraceae bacterium]|nr:DUF1874 domain-containing protein [Lachnospiraceae bacterium]
MTYLGNAFSAQMVSEFPATVTFEEVKPETIPVSVESCIGHADTANVVSSILGRHVACNRINVRLGHGDTFYFAQLTGGRLPEGATTLPEGFALKFIKATIA